MKSTRKSPDVTTPRLPYARAPYARTVRAVKVIPEPVKPSIPKHVSQRVILHHDPIVARWMWAQALDAERRRA